MAAGLSDEQWKKFLDGRFIRAAAFKRQMRMAKNGPEQIVKKEPVKQEEIERRAFIMCRQLAEHLGRTDGDGFTTTIKAYGRHFKITVDLVASTLASM